MATQRVSQLHMRIPQWLMADHQRTRGVTANGRLCNRRCSLREGIYRGPEALVLDRQEGQPLDTVKIADVPCHECRAGEQRCRSHDAIGCLEMILPMERTCQMRQA
jgi:hypothetical protein